MELLNCSAEQMRAAAHGHLTVGARVETDSAVTTMSGMVSTVSRIELITL